MVAAVDAAAGINATERVYGIHVMYLHVYNKILTICRLFFHSFYIFGAKMPTQTL